MLAVALGGACTLTIGYWARIRFREAPPPYVPTRTPETVIFLAATWVLLYSIAYLRFFGYLSPSSIASVLLSPGEAYAAKFQVWENSSGSDGLIQLVTLFSGFLTLLLPLLIIWWGKLGPFTRVYGSVAVIAYGATFVAIGTNQGLGYLVLFGLVGIGVKRFSGIGEGGRVVSRKATTLLVAFALLFLAYFGLGAIQRSLEFQANSPVAPSAGATVGTAVKYAFDSAVSYPTQGYLGLSYSLNQPFIFTNGYGSARALNRYVVQYLGGEDQEPLTYPERVEYYTGYPAGQKWHTVYSWLASDLTFAGSVLFMGVIGWVLAALWIRAVRELDILAIGLLSWVGLFVLFTPANNQIGLSQTNLIGAATLAFLFIGRGILRAHSSAKRGNQPVSVGHPTRTQVPDYSGR